MTVAIQLAKLGIDGGGGRVTLTIESSARGARNTTQKETRRACAEVTSVSREGNKNAAQKRDRGLKGRRGRDVTF